MRESVETPKYSIVVPVYNEEESFPDLVKRLSEVMELLDGPAEVVLVDDGSRDSSYQLMLEANRRDSRFKVLQLSRNFGHQVAITAGMDAASGQAVIVMDADLQDPPHVILEMAAKWQEGYEVVYAVRERREGETLFKKTTATLFYSLLRRMADIEQSVDVGDFRLVRPEGPRRVSANAGAQQVRPGDVLLDRLPASRRPLYASLPPCGP